MRLWPSISFQSYLLERNSMVSSHYSTGNDVIWVKVFGQDQCKSSLGSHSLFSCLHWTLQCSKGEGCLGLLELDTKPVCTAVFSSQSVLRLRLNSDGELSVPSFLPYWLKAEWGNSGPCRRVNIVFSSPLGTPVVEGR